MRAHSSEIHWRRVAHAIAFGILVPLAGVLGPALALAATSGCGGPMLNLHRSIGVAAEAAGACYKVVSAVNDGKAAQAKALEAGGDHEGALLLRSQWWDDAYQKARKACDSALALSEQATAASKTIEASLNKDKDAAGWISRLTALGFETVRILKDLGIEFTPPGGK